MIQPIWTPKPATPQVNPETIELQSAKNRDSTHCGDCIWL